ncbi:MAG: hypothetical protein JXA46_09905 [Dehalococcoidales bacterium]|nr:hypothetical protein [Dehalococcoidales bacterium]
MKKLFFSINRFFWWFWIWVIRAFGLPFLLSPVRLPVHEKQKLYDSALQYDVLIVFNSGGWGDATLEQADDFTPILNGMIKTLTRQGYRAGIMEYTRTLSSLSGRISGTKDQLLSFKHSSYLQVKDMIYLSETFPEKYFILAGFSTGGGLAGRALKSLTGRSNIFGLMVGVPGWFPTHYSERTLVLNNSGRDPVSCGRVNTIALTVFKAPLIWIASQFNNRKLSLALALQLPDHDYSWSSPEVGPPVTSFIQSRFSSRSNNLQAHDAKDN